MMLPWHPIIFHLVRNIFHMTLNAEKSFRTEILFLYQGWHIIIHMTGFISLVFKMFCLSAVIPGIIVGLSVGLDTDGYGNSRL